MGFIFCRKYLELSFGFTLNFNHKHVFLKQYIYAFSQNSMLLLLFFKTMYRTWRDISKQRLYIQSFLSPYLADLEQRFDGKFETDQLKKIKEYYGLFIPVMLCTSYKRLIGAAFTNEEKKRATLFGILTPVGDDLFDIDKLNNEAIEQITFEPQKFQAHTFSAKVAKEIQTSLLEEVPFHAAYINAAKNVYEIQLETEKQLNQAITNVDLERITYAKGGYSVIIYMEILDQKVDEEMRQVLFEIGSLMQLSNDLFDMYKDIQDGITTLANRCADFAQLKALFLEKVRACNQKLFALPYAQRRKLAFAISMYLVIGRGLIVIEQMMALEKSTSKPLSYATLSRKQLICDMEKPVNFLRALYYAYRLPKLQ